eukprot:scaffold653742_cov69-Prasinocladus_malaysianus.AAC.1
MSVSGDETGSAADVGEGKHRDMGNTSINQVDDDGMGLIHIVAALGYKWAVELLLQAGANESLRQAWTRERSESINQTAGIAQIWHLLSAKLLSISLHSPLDGVAIAFITRLNQLHTAKNRA